MAWIEPRDFNDPKYKRWRKAVYIRDKFRCQFPGCGGGSKKLEAHHIKRWADFPSLRYVVANGITLCKNCHDAIKDKEREYETVFQSVVACQVGGRKATLSVLAMKYARKREEEGLGESSVPGDS